MERASCSYPLNIKGQTSKWLDYGNGVLGSKLSRH